MPSWPPLLLAAGLAAAPADPVLVGAGDIGFCVDGKPSPAALATGKLLDGVLGTVFTLGDNAYNEGAASEFSRCYEPAWGRHKGRTKPSAGNHDYETPGAAGYYAYFGEVAGDPRKGYYSYDLDAWHVVVLNSNCRDVGGCAAGSPQERWLRKDLAAHPALCTLAYWHHPRLSSGDHGDDKDYDAFWRALHDAGVELVLTGHDHHYERFAPQDPEGKRDDKRGIVQFVVGTGGAPLRRLRRTQPNSLARDARSHGLLKLTLKPRGYDFQFLPAPGSAFKDSGSGRCR